MSDTFNTTPANWQGVDDEPAAGSDNLVKSGGVFKDISQLGQEMEIVEESNLIDKTQFAITNFLNGFTNTNALDIGSTFSILPTSQGPVTADSFGGQLAISVKSGEKVIVSMKSTSNSYAMAYVLLNTQQEILSWAGKTTQTFDWLSEPHIFNIENDGYIILQFVQSNYSENLNAPLSVQHYKIIDVAQVKEDVEDLQTDVTELQTDFKATLPYTQFGLAGIKKGTELSTIGPDEHPITPTEFSSFLLDMKLVGTPEENTVYRLRVLQHRVNSGGPSYSNGITISKSSDNWATRTDVAIYGFGSTAPKGIKLYDITPNNNSSLTSIKVLLNWDAISHIDANLEGNAYTVHSIPFEYQFDMAYMLHQDYGLIPFYDAHKEIVNVQTIEDNISYGLEIQLPNTIYAVEGTELNLWNDNIALSVDKGLQSPLNYSVGWQSNIGLITDRCFRFTPEARHVGNTYTLACYLYNIFGEKIAEKSVSIKVKAKNALSNAKRIVYFGDSGGRDTSKELYSDFNNSNKFTGIAPTMLGTKGTLWHYEAVGGYRWEDYATQGRRAFRCYVANFTEAIGINTTYTNNGFTWTVTEVNVTDGNGNILITKQDTDGTDAPSTDGNLVSTGSFATIPYTNATLEGANPLWNPSTQQLDVAYYRQLLDLSSSEKLDAVSFQFGGNDRNLASDLPTLYGYIKSLYDAFIADNPNCKFIVGLTTSGNNDDNGAGANYGATFNPRTCNWQLFTIRKLYLSLQSDATMPNLRIAPINTQLDRYYGFPFSTRQISQRYTETEEYHSNFFHCSESGYGQLGDAYFGAYIGVLTE